MPLTLSLFYSYRFAQCVTDREARVYGAGIRIALFGFIHGVPTKRFYFMTRYRFQGGLTNI